MRVTFRRVLLSQIESVQRVSKLGKLCRVVDSRAIESKSNETTVSRLSRCDLRCSNRVTAGRIDDWSVVRPKNSPRLSERGRRGDGGALFGRMRAKKSLTEIPENPTADVPLFDETK